MGKPPFLNQPQTQYRFTGQRFDETLAGGLYDYIARRYDPGLGRFTQADTIVPSPGDPQSLNRYAYTLNNPVRYVDPSGHYIIESPDKKHLPLESGYAILPESSKVSPFLPANHPLNPTNQGIRASSTTVQNWGKSITIDPRIVAAGQVLGEAAHMELHYDDAGNIDYRATLEKEVGDVLLICAKTVGINGVCGVSPPIANFQAAGPGMGARFSLDFVVDKHGDMGAFLSGGGGAYASTSIAEVMGGLTVFVIPNATIDDLQGTSVEFGGSAKAGVGLGVESIIMKSQSGQIFYGVAVSSYGGLGGEIHTTVTYSKMIYHTR